MQRVIWGALVALVLIVGTAPPAHAGRIFLFAESAQFRNGNVGCSMDSVATPSTTYNQIKCLDNVVGRFNLPAPFPPDSGNTWSYRVHGSSPTSASGVCAWIIQAFAFRDTSPFSAAGSTQVTASVTLPGDFNMHVTPATASTGVNDVLATVNCAGTLCQNSFVQIQISLDTATTSASDCSLRMLEIIY